MATFNNLIAAGVMVLLAYGSAAAQISPAEAERIRVRQQMATMEGILQRAIVNGAELVMAQLRNVIPAPPRLGIARVSGFRVDGFGVVFHVQVPQLDLPVTYEVLVDDWQNRTAMTIQRFQTQVSVMPAGPDRDRLQGLIVQLEQQLRVGNLRPAETRRDLIGAASLVPPGAAGSTTTVDVGVITEPEEAYSREVKAALIDAMLRNSQGVELGPDEWLMIMASSGIPSNPQFPGDSIDSGKGIIRVKGSVLTALRSNSITIEEARKQVEIRAQ